MGRYGSEDFWLGLPACALAAATAVAERLPARLANMAFGFAPRRALRCTLSVGLAAQLPVDIGFHALAQAGAAGNARVFVASASDAMAA